MSRSVTPAEAHAMMTKQEAVYVDVRTVAEFDAGHPTGAYNVPLMIDGPSGRGPNADFLSAMQGLFAVDRQLVIGCQAGVRSARASALLEGAGYTNVLDQSAGWGGAADAFGRITTPGWKASGLPVATTAEPGHRWAEITKRA
jgi:rhodanese-related sulfurtransferase